MRGFSVGRDVAGTSTPARERWAVIAFVVVAAGSFVFYTLLGRRKWFFNDEWDFLAVRRAGSIDQLLAPHFGHWSTLPILVYRLLWWSVGLRSYAPYLTLTILLHLLAAWLVRCVMRRAGVDPWVATVTASALVLFGRGEQDILWAFQITQIGSVVFGLTHLLLADHDGAFDRRDWLGLLAGTAGLLCSGVAVTMVIVVGIAALIRRSWRTAVAHTAPLAALYLAWYFKYARGSYTTKQVTPRSVGRFVVATLANAMRAFGSYDVVGVLLFGLLVFGLVIAWRAITCSEWRGRYSASFALLVGAVVFLVITAFGRAGLPGASERGRYLDIGLILVLPAVGIAADAVIRRWRRSAIVVLALLVVGIPGNVSYIETFTHAQARSNALFRTAVLELPRLAAGRNLPESFEPLPQMSMGWLRRGAASGRIPAPTSVTPAQQDAAALLLAIRATSPLVKLDGDCRRVTQPTPIALRAGETIQVRDADFTIVPATGPIAGSYSRVYRPETAISPEAGPVSFRVVPRRSGPRPRVCGPPAVFAPEDAAG